MDASDDESESDSDQTDSEESRDFYKFSHEEMMEIVSEADKGWSFNTIQHKHRRLKSNEEIRR